MGGPGPFSCLWLLCGPNIDWDEVTDNLVGWGTMFAGMAFGGGWWAWVDAVIVSQGLHGEKVPFSWYLPGITATLAALLMNCVRREDVSNGGDMYGDEMSDTCRVRSWLLFSFLVAIGSVGGAIAVLSACDQEAAHGLALGIGAVLQCAAILIGGVLFWTCRRPSEGAYMSL